RRLLCCRLPRIFVTFRISPMSVLFKYYIHMMSSANRSQDVKGPPRQFSEAPLSIGDRSWLRVVICGQVAVAHGLTRTTPRTMQRLSAGLSVERSFPKTGVHFSGSCSNAAAERQALPAARLSDSGRDGRAAAETAWRFLRAPRPQQPPLRAMSPRRPDRGLPTAPH